MVFGIETWGARSWAALALGCVLVLSGCSDDGADEPAGTPTESTEDGQDEQATADAPDEQATTTDAPDEQATTTDAPEEQAAGNVDGDCPVDAGAVSEVVGVGFELALDDVNELADGGTSCIYEGETDDVAVIAAVSVATWDGSDERVDEVVEQTAEFFDEPVATPDLGDQAFLFDDDFGGTSLVVFVDGEQYSTGLSGAGWTGTPLESLDERQAILVELYERATA